MCKEAREIQKQWKPKGGDRVISLHFNRCELEYLSTNIENKEASVLFHKHGSIWLPRQKDLQKIIFDDWKRIEPWNDRQGIVENMVWDFNNFVKETAFRGYLDLNTLWFMYAMKTVYNKVWDEKTWVKP